jgi:hypothetical protein
MSEEFKPIETQEAFDAAIKSRIERAKQSAADEAKKAFTGWISPDDAKKSAEQITALTGQLSERDKQIAELTAKVSASDAASLRMKIAMEAGLPAALAARLTGNTEEEIRKDAELLASLTKGSGTHRSDPERGEPLSGVEKAFFAKNPSLKVN